MRVHLLAGILSVLLVAFHSAEASEKAQSNAEVEYLLGFVEHSDARFVRGGTEYSCKQAADHLRLKLSRAGDRVKTAEDFIQGVASKSYLTGELYRVKFPNGKEQATGPWLMEALAKHRKTTRSQEDH